MDIIDRNFMDNVTQLNKMKAAMELWLEAFDLYCAATSNLSEVFDKFVSDSPYSSQHQPYAEVAESFSKMQVNMNHIVRPSVRDVFVHRCLKPTIAILSLVPEINAKVQERKTVLLDFDSYRAKVQKEHAAGRDSSHPQVMKKALKLDESAKKLFSLQTEICASFDEFETARPILMGPELAAFIGCLHHFNSFSTGLTGALLSSIPQSFSTLYMLEATVSQAASAGLFVANTPRSRRNQPPDAAVVKVGSTKTGNRGTLGSAAGSQLVPPAPPVEPVLQRSEVAGGGYGGYGSFAAMPPPQEAIAASSSAAAAQAVEQITRTAAGAAGGTGDASGSSGGMVSATLAAVRSSLASAAGRRPSGAGGGEGSSVGGDDSMSRSRRGSGSTVGTQGGVDGDGEGVGVGGATEASSAPTGTAPIHSLGAHFQAVDDEAPCVGMALAALKDSSDGGGGGDGSAEGGSERSTEERGSVRHPMQSPGKERNLSCGSRSSDASGKLPPRALVKNEILSGPELLRYVSRLDEGDSTTPSPSPSPSPSHGCKPTSAGTAGTAGNTDSDGITVDAAPVDSPQILSTRVEGRTASGEGKEREKRERGSDGETEEELQLIEEFDGIFHDIASDSAGTRGLNGERAASFPLSAESESLKMEIRRLEERRTQVGRDHSRNHSPSLSGGGNGRDSGGSMAGAAVMHSLAAVSNPDSNSGFDVSTSAADGSVSGESGGEEEGTRGVYRTMRSTRLGLIMTPAEDKAPEKDVQSD